MWRRVGQAAILLWLAACVIASHGRARVWHDSLSLWTDAVAKTPHAPRPQIDLARTLEVLGRHDEALVAMERSVLLAQIPSPFSEERRRQWYVIALANYARLKGMQGDFVSAEAALATALHVIPNSPLARYEYALVAYFQDRCTQKELQIDGTVTYKCPVVP